MAVFHWCVLMLVMADEDFRRDAIGGQTRAVRTYARTQHASTPASRHTYTPAMMHTSIVPHGMQP